MGKRSIAIIVSASSPKGSTHTIRLPIWWAYAVPTVMGTMFLWIIVSLPLSLAVDAESKSVHSKMEACEEKFTVLDEKIESFQTSFDEVLREHEKIRESVNISDPNRNIRPKINRDSRKMLLTSSSDMGTLVNVRAKATKQDAETALTSAKSLATYVKEQEKLLTSLPSLMPTTGYKKSGFGMRRDPFTGQTSLHKGMDIAVGEGNAVKATGDGTVIVTGKHSRAGNMVKIDHGRGVVTTYMHLSHIDVKAGDNVRRGDIIAETGNTGRSTGPHLHYEVTLNGIPQDPKRFILE